MPTYNGDVAYQILVYCIKQVNYFFIVKLQNKWIAYLTVLKLKI